MSSSQHVQAIQYGTWLYDESVTMGIWIVEMDYDYWFALDNDDGYVQEGRSPHLNPEGFQYYVYFGGYLRDNYLALPDSPGFDCPAKAREWAQSKVPTPVQWLE